MDALKFYLLATIIWIAPSFAVFVWNASNERRFLELFRKKVNPKFAVTHKERMELAESNPLAFLSSGMSYSFNTFRSIWKNYDNDELNQAAKQTRKGYIFTIIAMFTG